tara:strand:- start:347 stop:463 length:117 start_codon:yes stop_codon:yes gene_type:complete
MEEYNRVMKQFEKALKHDKLAIAERLADKLAKLEDKLF